MIIIVNHNDTNLELFKYLTPCLELGFLRIFARFAFFSSTLLFKQFLFS